VGNSPIAHTDPTGTSFLGKAWGKITKAVGTALAKVPILRTVIQVLAVAACGGVPVCAVIAAAATSAALTGLSGGSLSQSLRAGLITGATALAFTAIGNAGLGYVEKIASHAAVGCVSAAASGGKCGQGALSAGISAAGSPLVTTVFPNYQTESGDFLGGAAASAAIGGIASVAGGGKFAAGAETAAFGYLFNACQGMLQCLKSGGGAAVLLGQWLYPPWGEANRELVS
jgi:hypothetical protein